MSKAEKEKAMNKQEFIKKIQELREDGEDDLRTVIYFAEQLDEPSREEAEEKLKEM
jgi:sulfur transfer protein SufE